MEAFTQKEWTDIAMAVSDHLIKRKRERQYLTKPQAWLLDDDIARYEEIIIKIAEIGRKYEETRRKEDD